MEDARPQHVGRASSAAELYCLPLGAGGHSVRINGRIFEAFAAQGEQRPACDLYHSALRVISAGSAFVIEMTPVSDDPGRQHGVVDEPQGVRQGSRWRAAVIGSSPAGFFARSRRRIRPARATLELPERSRSEP